MSRAWQIVADDFREGLCAAARDISARALLAVRRREAPPRKAFEPFAHCPRTACRQGTSDPGRPCAEMRCSVMARTAGNIVHGDVVQISRLCTFSETSTTGMRRAIRARASLGHGAGKHGQPVNAAGNVRQHGLVVFRVSAADEQRLPPAPALELDAALDLVHVQRKQPEILIPLEIGGRGVGVAVSGSSLAGHRGRVQQVVVGKQTQGAGPAPARGRARWRWGRSPVLPRRRGQVRAWTP